MKKLVFLSLVALFCAGCSSQKKELDNLFYPFNNAFRTLQNAPESFDAQSACLVKLGFKGFAGHQSDSYFPRRVSLDKFGLCMPEIYWGITMDADGNVSYNKELKDIIIDSKDRNLTVTLHSHAKDFMNRFDEGDPLFAKGMRELADFAAQYNVKVAVYPHVSNYCETVDHCIDMVKLVDRSNFGMVFNTCHMLKVEGEQGWEERLKKSLPYLFMISINGADSGDTRKMGWDRLIQPLGEGTFDIYKLVKLAVDNGYKGPFGLQCYNMKQDCEAALTKSMNTWHEFQKRYAEGK